MLNSTTFKNVSESTEIGGLAYFLVYISEYLPYVILISLGEFFGILGNLLILGTVITNKELHSPTYMLVFNLAIADLIVTGVIDSFILAGVFVGEQFFDHSIAFCQFIGASCLITCISSMMSIGLLAFNRYIHICHHHLFDHIFGPKLTILYCFCTWIIGALIQLPNVTGWGGYFYDPKTLNCVWNRLASQSYSLFFPLSSIVAPSVAVLFFYVCIFIYSYKSRRKVSSSLSISSIKSKRKMHERRSLRLAQGLFSSFMLFVLCWLPYGLVVMSDYSDRLPRTAIMFTMAIAHLNSSLNFILYALFNSSFRRGYIVLFQHMRIVSSEASQGTSQTGH